MKDIDTIRRNARSSGDRAELLRYLRARRERMEEPVGFTGKAKDSVFEGDVEDVSDIIGIVSPHETPLLDHLGDADRARVAHGQVFNAWVDVNGSLQASRSYGVADEVDYQKQERMRELLRDLENCVINGVCQPSSLQIEVRHQISGLVSQIKTHAYEHTTGLDENILNVKIKDIHNDGGRVGTIVVGGAQKRRINSFVNGTRAYLPDGQVYSDMVSVYESDFGVCRVILSRWVPSDSLLLLDATKIKVAPVQGRSFHYRQFKSEGDSISGQIVGEYTLSIGEECSHGIITGLSV